MLGYVLTAVVATSVGVLIGGLAAFSKVAFLDDRLAIAEGHLEMQGRIIRDLSGTIHRLLDAAEGRMLNSVDVQSMSDARAMLETSDRYLEEVRRDLSKSGEAMP